MEYSHRLHSGYFNNQMRIWQSTAKELSKENLVYPIFISDLDDSLEEIPSLPNQYRIGVNKITDFIDPLVKKGLGCVLLFGVPTTMKKDERGVSADDPENPVIRALPILHAAFPNLTLACDLCLCAYTSHGHCGFLDVDGYIDNSATIKRLTEIGLAFSKAGCQILAPSDAMDSRVGALKAMLKANALDGRVAVMSYSVKFCSSLYGPFRDAAKSAPSFGDRKAYQLPPPSLGLALRAAGRDVDEGADILMVKPALHYLDVVRAIHTNFPNHPLAVYHVSGEYAMLCHAAKAGAIDLKAVALETMTAFSRAGATIVITYLTPQLLDWI